jgi:hypothetical protein
MLKYKMKYTMKKTKNSTSLIKLLLVVCMVSCSTPTTVTARPKYTGPAQLLSSHHEYFETSQGHASADYWKLSSYYVHQITGSSCTAASLSMMMNFFRNPESLQSSDKLFTQKNIHGFLKYPEYEKAVAEGGPGYSLEPFSKIVERALTQVLGLRSGQYQVELIRVTDTSDATYTKIKNLLIKNEHSDKNMILSNFLQSEFTGDPDGAVGHVSPIAAFDEQNESVLVMDVDREWYEPYWVPLKTFIKGMNTKDMGANQYRGLIFVSVQ